MLYDAGGMLGFYWQNKLIDKYQHDVESKIMAQIIADERAAAAASQQRQRRSGNSSSSSSGTTSAHEQLSAV